MKVDLENEWRTVVDLRFIDCSLFEVNGRPTGWFFKTGKGGCLGSLEVNVEFEWSAGNEM